MPDKSKRELHAMRLQSSLHVDTSYQPAEPQEKYSLAKRDHKTLRQYELNQEFSKQLKSLKHLTSS